jgi:serine/threonine protein kinase
MERYGSISAESEAYFAPERREGTLGFAASHVYSFGCVMWELYVTQSPWRGHKHSHPSLGRFPASTPLNYALLSTACLSEAPADRPTFPLILEVLSDLQADLNSRYYTDLCGTTQVRLRGLEAIRFLCIFIC